MRSKSTTIADVAERAGVSIATVSRALRGFDNVAPATAELVVTAARDLGYTTNSHASMLRSGTSGTVTLVVPSVGDWYHSELMAGAEAVLSDLGYDTLVSVAANEDEFKHVIASARPIRSRADGLIIVEQQIRDLHIRKLDEWNCPAVVVAQHVQGLHSVAIDDFEVGAVVAEHLIGLGHTRIGLLEGAGHRDDETSAQVQRRSGFSETLRKYGLKSSPELCVASPYTILGGRRSVGTLFAQPKPPTAVFCMSDHIAVGAMQTLRDLGLEIPHDVSVVGVDDLAISRLLGLTTVRQPVSEMGAEAARLLVDNIGQEATQADQQVRFPSELVVRSTTAPPSSS